MTNTTRKSSETALQMFDRAGANAGNLANRLPKETGVREGTVVLIKVAGGVSGDTEMTQFLNAPAKTGDTSFKAPTAAVQIGDGTLWGAVTALNAQRHNMPADEYTAADLMQVISNCPGLMARLDLSNATELNTLHLAELLGTFTMRDESDTEMANVRRILTAFGINLKGFEHGILSSDYGKYPEGKDAVTGKGAESIELLNQARAKFLFATLCDNGSIPNQDKKIGGFELSKSELSELKNAGLKKEDILRIKNNAYVTQLLRPILKNNFGKNSILNPDLDPKDAMELFSKHGILQGFMHELPGLRLLFEKVNTGALSETDFKDAILTTLGHNGPHAGFWQFLTDTLVPKFVNDKGALERIFKGGIFWDDNKNCLAYPMPQSAGGVMHTSIDRLSQGTGLGAMKILRELGETDLANIAQNMFGANQGNTNKQLLALANHTIECIKEGGIGAFEGSLALALIAKSMDRIDATADLVEGRSEAWTDSMDTIKQLAEQARTANRGRTFLDLPIKPVKYESEDLPLSNEQKQTLTLAVPYRNDKTLGFNQYTFTAYFDKPTGRPIKSNTDFKEASIKKSTFEYKFSGPSGNPTLLDVTKANNGESGEGEFYSKEQKGNFDRELFSALNGFVRYERTVNKPTEDIIRNMMRPLGTPESKPPKANGLKFEGVKHGGKKYASCTRNYYFLQRMVAGFKDLIGTRFGTAAKSVIGDVSADIIKTLEASVLASKNARIAQKEAAEKAAATEAKAAAKK